MKPKSAYYSGYDLVSKGTGWWSITCRMTGRVLPDQPTLGACVRAIRGQWGPACH